MVRWALPDYFENSRFPRIGLSRYIAFSPLIGRIEACFFLVHFALLTFQAQVQALKKILKVCLLIALFFAQNWNGLFSKTAQAQNICPKGNVRIHVLNLVQVSVWENSPSIFLSFELCPNGVKVSRLHKETFPKLTRRKKLASAIYSSVQNQR